MIRRTFHALSTLAALAGTVAAALYRDRAAHAEEREDAAHDLVCQAIEDKQKAWTELGLMRDRAGRAEATSAAWEKLFRAGVAYREHSFTDEWNAFEAARESLLVVAPSAIDLWPMYAAEMTQATAPIEHTVVDAVACTWCGEPAGDWRKQGQWVWDAREERLALCMKCHRDASVTAVAVRARYAARAAQTVAAAVEPPK